VVQLTGAVGANSCNVKWNVAFGRAYIANEQFTQATGQQVLAAGQADAVAFGVPFIANPDLPERFRHGAPLNEPDPSTFYAAGAKGYTDYPFWHQTA
jgi:2,4-dienoyl-CoA reductase-like NADH-dependent reductase (Old Yellow Enzyme family)